MGKGGAPLVPPKAVLLGRAKKNIPQQSRAENGFDRRLRRQQKNCPKPGAIACVDTCWLDGSFFLKVFLHAPQNSWSFSERGAAPRLERGADAETGLKCRQSFGHSLRARNGPAIIRSESMLREAGCRAGCALRYFPEWASLQPEATVSVELGTGGMEIFRGRPGEGNHITTHRRPLAYPSRPVGVSSMVMRPFKRNDSRVL